MRGGFTSARTVFYARVFVAVIMLFAATLLSVVAGAQTENLTGVQGSVSSLRFTIEADITTPFLSDENPMIEISTSGGALTGNLTGDGEFRVLYDSATRGLLLEVMSGSMTLSLSNGDRFVLGEGDYIYAAPDPGADVFSLKVEYLDAEPFTILVYDVVLNSGTTTFVVSVGGRNVTYTGSGVTVSPLWSPAGLAANITLSGSGEYVSGTSVVDVTPTGTRFSGTETYKSRNLQYYLEDGTHVVLAPPQDIPIPPPPPPTLGGTLLARLPYVLLAATATVLAVITVVARGTVRNG